MTQSFLGSAFATLCLVTASTVQAAAFSEDFASNPLESGWKIEGTASLFQWNASAGSLDVTWNSSEPNSFFSRPLGVTLSKADDFSLALDLRMESIAIGVDPAKPFTFQIAAGFVNLAQATSSNYFRGSGFDSPNLVEFNYFPDSGFGATIAPTLISTNHQFAAGFNFPFELTLTDLFHVEMNYTAADRTLRTTMTRNGEIFGPFDPVTLAADFTDFAVDHVAIVSYSDDGQHPDFGGSILARGVVDNLRFTVPDAPVGLVQGELTAEGWRVRFATLEGWVYTLQRTGDFQSWNSVGLPENGTGGIVSITDSNLSSGAAFYRVSANRQ